MISSSVQNEQAVLVLAPHPDDETFGCGGTMRLLADSGVPVDVAFLTRGELGCESAQQATHDRQQEVARVRTGEAHAACERLGTRELYFLDGHDTRLDTQPHLADVIGRLLDENRYRRVFCPWWQDSHPDHLATFALLREAVRRRPSPIDVWLYEVWRPLPHNMVVSIDPTIDAKSEAILQYKSQLELLDYHSAIRGIAAYRALFTPPSRYAEAFLVCDRSALLELPAPAFGPAS